VLRDVGWELLDRPRAGRVGAGGHVALDVEGPGGITTWSGLAVARAFTAAASCGASPEPMVEWSVAAVERHPSSSATW
jgi:hypothetical protein